MKQTVEEAAKEARMASAETLTTYGTHTSLDDFTYLSHDEIAESAFVKGAEWQKQQSPWISVKERLPEKSGWVFVAGGMNAYRALFYCAGKFYSDVRLGTYDSGVTHWMPIPWLEDFNYILDANKDVLKRIKENGD